MNGDETHSSAPTVDTFDHRWEPTPGSASRPVLLLLHGTGGDENDLLPLGRLFDPTAALLSPRGRVQEHGMPRFFRRIAEGVFDLEDLRVRTAELADWVAAAATRYGFDPRRVVAVGFSNGANIAGSLLLSRPGVLAGAVLFSPMVPFEPDPPPSLAGTPVFIGAGQHDPIAPPTQVRHLQQILERAGADVTVHWTSAGHTVTPDEIEAARTWLARF